jgi:hypothetical protein
VSQDAYQGSAQYTVSVDGQQIGGTFTAGASHASGQHDTLTLHGDWGPGQHKVEVEMVNDLWVPGSGDRNVYVTEATYNGAATPALGGDWWGGEFLFTDAGSAPPPVVVPPVEPPPVVVPPVEPPPVVVPPVAPMTADIMGGAGADTLNLAHLRGVSVSGGGGADTIVLGAGHKAVEVVLNAGEAEGDVITGFHATGRQADTLVFHGYGEGAELEALGGGVFSVASADGAIQDHFTLAGINTLDAGDYLFT